MVQIGWNQSCVCTVDGVIPIKHAAPVVSQLWNSKSAFSFIVWQTFFRVSLAFGKPCSPLPLFVCNELVPDSIPCCSFLMTACLSNSYKLSSKFVLLCGISFYTVALFMWHIQGYKCMEMEAGSCLRDTVEILVPMCGRSAPRLGPGHRMLLPFPTWSYPCICA